MPTKSRNILKYTHQTTNKQNSETFQGEKTKNHRKKVDSSGNDSNSQKNQKQKYGYCTV